MCDVVGRLLSSCISRLTRRRTTITEKYAASNREYNTGDVRHDGQPLPLSGETKTEMNGLKEDTKEVGKSMKGVNMVIIEKKKEMEEKKAEMKNFSNNDDDEPRTAIELRVANANAGRVNEDYEEEITSGESFSDYCITCCSPLVDADGMMIAIEPGNLKEPGSWIPWKEGDDIIRKMQSDRMSKDEEIPSFWNYDPRCLAKEFIGLDQKSFLADSSAFNICFFDKDILCKICKMLSPIDFLNLSYTCRFLHWRLFTFCTCYAHYLVYFVICDHNINYYGGAYKTALNKTIYPRRLDENDRRSMPNHAELEGLRIVAARFPSCLQKPFFFSKLNFAYSSPFFTTDDFDRCLPFILPVRKYAGQLHIEMSCTNRTISKKFFDYQAVNDFLKAINATSYFCRDHFRTAEYYQLTLKVFENCPYTHVMDTLDDIHFDNSSKWENLVLLNRIGHYHSPPVSTIIRTIEEFKYGSANLDYHEYELEDRARRIAFLEYLFANYGEIEEYLWYGYRMALRKTIRFVTITTKKTGRRHRMKVWSYNDSKLYVAVGKDDILRKILKKRPNSGGLEDCNASYKWFRMETALEPVE